MAASRETAAGSVEEPSVDLVALLGAWRAGHQVRERKGVDTVRVAHEVALTEANRVKVGTELEAAAWAAMVGSVRPRWHGPDTSGRCCLWMPS